MESGFPRASVAGIVAILCCAGACADLLNVPGDPRLVAAANAPAGEAGASIGVGGHGDGNEASGGAGTGEVEGNGRVATNGGSASQSDAVDVHYPDAAPVIGATPDSGISAPPDAGLPLDAAAPPPSGPCGAEESLGPNGNCFAFIATLLDWESARQGCRTRGQGWDLAAGRSLEVSGFIAGLSAEEGWIGASDASAEGAWVWISDEAPFWNGDGLTGAAVAGAYENWSSDEPNGEDGSNCARLVPAREGVWADLECETPRGSFCEGPPR